MNVKTLILILVTFFCAVIGAIVFGGPKQPTPMPSINEPFKVINYPGLPEVKYFTARDDSQLGYREYSFIGNTMKGSVVIIHGSSASSISMHTLAKGIAQNGYSTYALDIRGHGVSGSKGQIEYIGQLEDDLEDFLQSVTLAGKKTLIGFSAGGGFALRFASSAKQRMFDYYVLLSPFIHQDAPTTRSDGDKWVNVGVPRIIALTLLNLFGVTVFNTLPVTTFALDAEAQTLLTPQYSFALSQNFRPSYDYRADIDAVTQPLEILVGQNDETLHAEHFSSVFNKKGKVGHVTIIPKIGHVDIILSIKAIQAILAALESLNAHPPNQG